LFADEALMHKVQGHRTQPAATCKGRWKKKRKSGICRKSGVCAFFWAKISKGNAVAAGVFGLPLQWEVQLGWTPSGLLQGESTLCFF
jgi:hypothetical protein